MSARLCASLRVLQFAISLRVRPQPMHIPVWPLTAQTLMQGVMIGELCIRFIISDPRAAMLIE
jgi:hypothetical protein